MIYVPEPEADGLRRYGAWAGNSKGWPENTKLCVYEVYEGIGRAHQCTRKRGHGPNGLYCKQHDPVAASARADVRHAEWERKNRVRNRPHRQNQAALEVLRKIAAGHNDARGLAEDLLSKWDEL